VWLVFYLKCVCGLGVWNGVCVFYVVCMCVVCVLFVWCEFVVCV